MIISVNTKNAASTRGGYGMFRLQLPYLVYFIAATIRSPICCVLTALLLSTAMSAVR